jgi:hypothetical protein
MRKAFALLIALVLANFALAQNKPLACQTDATAGLNWEAGRWQIRSFIAEKFILVQSGNTLTNASVAKAFDSPETLVNCYTTATSNITCTGISGSLLFFNPKNLRGGLSNVFGATMESEKRDSVTSAAFSCTPF